MITTRTAITLRQSLTILGVGSCAALVLTVLQLNGELRSAEGKLRTLTPCEATARQAELDGQMVAIRGRYPLNPSASVDAPDVLGVLDKTGCGEPGAEGGVLVDTSRLGHSAASGELQKYKSDLIPYPCPPKAICMPEKHTRYLYVDIVAKGRFEVIPLDKRFAGGPCCRFTVEDVISIIHVGPETKPEPVRPSRNKPTQ